MKKFTLGFLCGCIYFWKGPGSDWVATKLYTYEINRWERQNGQWS